MRLTRSSHRIAGPLTGLFTLCLTLPAWSQSEDTQIPRPDGEGLRKIEGKGPGGAKRDSDPFKELTPEQREKLRAAIRQAWNDPTVIEARSQLKVAAESYQRALQDSLARIAPDLKEPIARMRKESGSSLKGIPSHHGMQGPRPGGGGPGGRNRREYDPMVTLERPSFLEDLSPNQQQTYRQAHQAAMGDIRVKDALEALNALRQKDEAMRMKRYEAIRTAHQAIRKVISESNPEFEEHLARPRNGSGRSGPGPSKMDRPGPPPGADRPPLED